MAKKINYVEMKKPLYWIGICNSGINLKTFTHELTHGWGSSVKAEDGTIRSVTQRKLNLDNLGRQGGEYKYTMYSHTPISVEGFLKLCLADQELILSQKKNEIQKVESFIEIIKQNIECPQYIGQVLSKPTKVYTVISRWVYDTGESGMNFLGTFTDKEKALECFEQTKKDAKTDFNNGAVNCEEDSKEELHEFNDYTEFEIYEDGNFNYNHIVVTLKEEPIK